MRLKGTYTLMEFRGNYLLVRNGGEGGSNGDSGRVSMDKGMQVNGSFAFLWKTFFGKDFTEKDIADALLSEYDLSVEEASSAASEIVSLWRENDMILL